MRSIAELPVELQDRLSSDLDTALPVLGAARDPFALFADDSFSLVAVQLKRTLQPLYELWSEHDHTHAPPSAEEQTAFLSAVNELRRRPGQHTEILLGALHSRWLETISRIPEARIMRPYRIWRSAHLEKSDSVDPPTGYIFRQGHGDDADSMHLYSEVSRTVEYYREHCDIALCLAPKSNASGPAVAWALPQADLAISTVGVLPEYRQKGLATALARRLSAMIEETHQLPAFSYVSDENEASKALMRRLGRQPVGHLVHWVYVPVASS